MATQGEPTQPGHDAGGAQPYRLIHDNWKEAEARFKRSQTYVDAICAMCNTPTTKTCSTCGSVHYCSPICQKSDWPLHKLCCKVYALFEPDKRSRLVRTILFAVESEAPLPMITGLSVDTETGRFQVATWTDTLRMEDDGEEDVEDKIETMCITRNPLRRRDLRGPGRAGTGKSDTYEGHVIILKMRRDREKMPRNKALEACAKACGFDFAFSLHGPVLALRQEIGAGLYRACTLQDLRDVVDYLRLHGTQDKHGLSYIQLKRAPVGGCSMACWGEYLSNGLDAVGPTLFPEKHCILNGAGEILPISKLLGLPVIMWKPAKHEWSKKNRMLSCSYSVASNLNASALQMIIDPDSPFWGQPSEGWEKNLGNVLVVRRDGKDLDPEILFLMASYVREKLESMCKMALDAEAQGFIGMRQQVLDHIKWEKMMEWKDSTGTTLDRTRAFEL